MKHLVVTNNNVTLQTGNIVMYNEGDGLKGIYRLEEVSEEDVAELMDEKKHKKALSRLLKDKKIARAFDQNNLT